MKKWIKVFIVLAVLAAIILGVYLWQRNNISAIVSTVTKTEEEIKKELDAGKKNLETDLKEKYNATVITDFTAEEEKKIMKGEITQQQVADIIAKKSEEIKKENNTESKKTQKDNKASKIDELIGDKAIELYSLKAYYLGKLGQMEADVKKDYIALPKEKKNLIGKQQLINKYMGTATSLLKQCDDKVNGLLKELEKDLKALNADLSIIKTIRDSYENEKALKKAYYLKLLGE